MPFVGLEVSLPPLSMIAVLPSEPDPPSFPPESDEEPPESGFVEKPEPLLELHDAIASGARPKPRTIDAFAARCFMARTLLRDLARGESYRKLFQGLAAQRCTRLLKVLCITSSVMPGT